MLLLIAHLTIAFELKFIAVSLNADVTCPGF